MLHTKGGGGECCVDPVLVLLSEQGLRQVLSEAKGFGILASLRVREELSCGVVGGVEWRETAFGMNAHIASCETNVARTPGDSETITT